MANPISARRAGDGTLYLYCTSDAGDFFQLTEAFVDLGPGGLGRAIQPKPSQQNEATTLP